MKLTPKVIASGVAVYFATAVGAYLYLRGSKASKGACGCAGGDGGHEGEEEEQLLRRRRGQPVQPLDSTVWSRLAAHYDREIDMDERVMGIKLLRWWLIRQARVRRGYAAATAVDGPAGSVGLAGGLEVVQTSL